MIVIVLSGQWVIDHDADDTYSIFNTLYSYMPRNESSHLTDSECGI